MTSLVNLSLHTLKSLMQPGGVHKDAQVCPSHSHNTHSKVTAVPYDYISSRATPFSNEQSVALSQEKSMLRQHTCKKSIIRGIGQPQNEDLVPEKSISEAILGA